MKGIINIFLKRSTFPETFIVVALSSIIFWNLFLFLMNSPIEVTNKKRERSTLKGNR